MISGKIILKSATSKSLDQRFGEIAKQAPPPARIPQQTHVIIPQTRQELFGNRPSAALNTANRLKKRSINYRLGLGANANRNRQLPAPRTPKVFQRLSFGNRPRGGGGGANSYLFGGQSGMGIRLRGQGRIGTRIFRSRTRGYLNNNVISRVSGYNRRGNNNNTNNRGGRFQNRPTNRGRGRGRGGNKNFTRGRGNNRKNTNNSTFTKETLDNELEKYMAQTKLDTDSIEMNAV